MQKKESAERKMSKIKTKKVLTPEQKKTFDEQAQFGPRNGRGPRGGMRGPGPQGPGNPPPAN